MGRWRAQTEFAELWREGRLVPSLRMSLDVPNPTFFDGRAGVLRMWLLWPFPTFSMNSTWCFVNGAPG